MFLHCKCRLNLLINHLKYFDLVSQKNLHLSIINRRRKSVSLRKSVNHPTQNYEEHTPSDVFNDSNSDGIGNKNFYGIEGDEGVIFVDQMPQSISRSQKLVNGMVRKNPEESFDGYRYLNYGAIRLDNENKPTYYIDYKNRENNVTYNHEHVAKGVEKIENQTVIDTARNPIDKSYRVNLNLNISNTAVTDEFHNSDLSESLEKQYFGRLYDTDLNKIVSRNEETAAKMKKHQTVVENTDNLINRKVNLDQDISNKVTNESFPNSDSSNTIEEQFFGELYDSDLNKRFSMNSTNISREMSSCNEESDINKFTEELSKSFSNFHSTDQSKLNSQGSFKDSESFIDASCFGENFSKEPVFQKNKFSRNIIEEQYFNDFKENSAGPNIESGSTSFITESQFPGDQTKNANYLSGNYVKEFSVSKKDLKVNSKTYNKTKSLNIKQQFNFGKKTIPLDKTEKDGSLENKIEKSNLKFSETGYLPGANKDAIKSINLSEKYHEKNTIAEEKPETALDFVKKLKPRNILSDEVKKGISAKKERKKDSKGFRILKHQVPSLQYFTRTEMLDLLKQNVLYTDDDIVVLNKPYNLVIHESGSTKDLACLSRYLDELASILDRNNDSPKLFTVHRLDKETTGCLMLARNEISAQRLKSLFSQRKITKTYWIVTSKVPDPMEGVINIPISEGKIKDKARMVLHPILPKDVPYVNHSKCGKQAVTQYSVISVSGNAALVEVKPETGIKHQIRVHFGFGLGCPILGDHKYSHLDKLVPQQLPGDLLQKLEVRQSKVRHIPLHIHAKHILIPRYADGRNLFVTAPLPYHMVENLRFLKFKKN